jgi:hypothetical protein
LSRYWLSTIIVELNSCRFTALNYFWSRNADLHSRLPFQVIQMFDIKFYPNGCPSSKRVSLHPNICRFIRTSDIFSKRLPLFPAGGKTNLAYVCKTHRHSQSLTNSQSLTKHLKQTKIALCRALLISRRMYACIYICVYMHTCIYKYH